ncbi:hypothetical protein PybrP1_008142 [[Pythium] brassicae (nom. inval.)]|nr:hypothetical protein PybrP1_008142 [[Pythium] brassicae (nom. inval.)]
MKTAATASVLAFALSATTTFAASNAVTIAPDCTQDQRTFVNTLLQQDKNPFRPCATRVGGDITTLSTSRLCPIAECKVWIEYMAGNAPNCVYDDTNYSTSYIAKAKDCGSAIGNSTAGSEATPKPATGGSKSGSDPDAGTPTTAKPTTTKPPSSGSRGKSGSGSGRDDNTIEAPTSSIPTVTVPDSPIPTSSRTLVPSVTPASGAAALSAVATLCAVALSAATLAF